MPIIQDVLELVSQCLYDQIDVGDPRHSRSYHLFQCPVGQRDGNQIKTFLQTGQFLPGQLPAPQKFLATRLNALFLWDGKPLRLYETDLYAHTEIGFSIMDKTYWRGPAWLCASPFALFGTPKEETLRLKADYGIEWEKVGATLKTVAARIPGYESPEEISDGILIETQVPFQVRADIYTDSHQAQLAFHIDGVLARPVM